MKTTRGHELNVSMKTFRAGLHAQSDLRLAQNICNRYKTQIVSLGGTSSNMEFHYILGKIGEFGNFQYLLCFYAICVSFLMGVPYLSQIMLTITPNHWCKVPQITNTILTADEHKYLTIPKNSDIPSSYSQCRMYAFNNISSMGTNSTSEMLDQIHSGTVSSVSCQNGWNFDQSIQYKSLVTEVWYYLM